MNTHDRLRDRRGDSSVSILGKDISMMEEMAFHYTPQLVHSVFLALLTCKPGVRLHRKSYYLPGLT